MPKSRPPYPEEFRREAVQLVRSGRTVKDVAESLGVTEPSLRTWVKRDQLERRERDDGLTVAEYGLSEACEIGASANVATTAPATAATTARHPTSTSSPSTTS